MATAIFETAGTECEAKALQWAQQSAPVWHLQSNGYEDEYGALNAVLAVDAHDTFRSSTTQTFTQLENFRAKHAQQWMFGFFSYDLKNEIENLHTDFP